MNPASALLRGVAWASALLVLMVGVYWSFARDPNDFKVFYSAFKIVGEVNPDRIYGGHPDRYLYAPGFAYLLQWLSWFSFEGALGIWNISKVLLLVASVLRVFGWKGLFVIPLAAKPLLIDFQYGQVNVQIVALGLWAIWLVSRGAEVASRFERVTVWALLTFFGAAKLMVAPLLLVPLLGFFLARDSLSRRRYLDSLIAIFGMGGVLLLVPFFAFGMEMGLHLMHRWFVCVSERGLPLETHNQSVIALMHRLFSGELSHVIALARAESFSTGLTLSRASLNVLGWIWVFLGVSFLLFGVWKFAKERALGFGLGWFSFFLVPGHLVWKPYFVFLIPLFGWLLTDEMINKRLRAFALLVGFSLLNLTGFDFLGLELAVKLEAWGVMMWALLILLIAWAMSGFGAQRPGAGDGRSRF